MAQRTSRTTSKRKTTVRKATVRGVRSRPNNKTFSFKMTPFSIITILRAVYRGTLTTGKHVAIASFALLLVLSSARILSAFEAFVVNTTATFVQIDPPTIEPPSGEYNSFIDVTIFDNDPDATHIFYTVTPGTDPSLALDPSCGIYPGGLKPIGPFTLEDDAVVKAIACDGDGVLAHASSVTTAIYDISVKAKVEGRKYHDLDMSATLTEGDLGLEGWHISLLSGTTTIAITVTGPGGYYTFTDLDPGDYTVQEESIDGWTNNSPVSVDVTLGAGETASVNFLNFDSGFSCVPQQIEFTTNVAVQAAGTTSGNDDVAIASNVTINGDVRSNDELEKIGGGSNRIINGNVTVVNTIDSGFVISGTVTTSSPTGSLPNINIPTWKAKAQDGGTVNGSFTFPNNTVGLVMGPTEIMGDVTFGSSNSLTVKGPLYIHGNLTIGSNSTIIQDSAFGNQFTTIIVDGTIDISSNITFSGAGSIGTFLLVSTHAAVSGTDAAIETNSNNSDLGDVVLYASDGDVHINSNRTLLAIFASHGTESDSDDNAAVRLDSNVTVNYRTLPTTISCGPRQPYESTSHILINEFMPNPIGSDSGTAGGTLDGEWVELFNPTSDPIDVAGYILYDSINTHALPITTSNLDTGNTIIPSLGYAVVYRNGDGDFELNNAGGDTVRLFTDTIGSGGILVDSHTYTRDAPENKSFARVPDGASNWIDPDPTPGSENWFFFEPLSSGSRAFVPPNLPLLEVPEDEVVIVQEEALTSKVLGISTDMDLPIEKGTSTSTDPGLEDGGAPAVEQTENATTTEQIEVPVPEENIPLAEETSAATSTEEEVIVIEPEEVEPTPLPETPIESQ